jgi:hypothetical protein
MQVLHCLGPVAVQAAGGQPPHVLQQDGDEFIGRTVSVAGEHLTGEEFAAAFSESYGEPVAYRPLTFDKFRAQGFPAAAELGNIFQYYYLAEAEFTGSRDLALVRTLNPQLQTFRSWLRTPSPLNNHPADAYRVSIALRCGPARTRNDSPLGPCFGEASRLGRG